MIYGYIRVSTDPQNCENQKFEIENYCKNNNLKINILDKFDTYMAEIRNSIEDNITVLSGDGNKMLVEYNAKIVINNMLNLLKATQDKVRGDSCGIESII